MSDNKSYSGNVRMKYEDLYGIVAGSARLRDYSYPLPLPKDFEGPADTLVGLFESSNKCRRCGASFVPSKHYSDSTMKKGVCRYRSERPERIGGLMGDTNGCCTFEWHVFEGYKPGDSLPRYRPLEIKHSSITAVALDAEMMYTVGGYEVCRVTLVDFFTESTLLDVLVRPRFSPVLDYNTKWSGVSVESYR